MTYTESKEYLGTSAIGVLMVDQGGYGVWLGHTVPGYPDLTGEEIFTIDHRYLIT